jgi:hypothetical protein
MSWLNDIKKQKSEEDKRRRVESTLIAKRVREKGKKVNSMVIKLLGDFGKACWGSGILSQSYAIQSGLRGQNWVWRIEHVYDERGITTTAELEVHLKTDPRTVGFEFMLIQPEKLSDVGPRCACSQEGLKAMLGETYESWLKEAHKHNLRR